MHRLVATLLLAVSLTLASSLLVASASPIARAQAVGGPDMPILDDFNRPDEDPLSGGGNWARTDLGVWNAMRLVSNAARRSASGTSASYWTQASFAGGTGSVWAKWGSLGSATRASIALYREVGGTNAVDGYEFAREVAGAADNDYYLLYRVTNGARTSLGGVENTAEMSYRYFNLQRTGRAVEGWASPDGANWTLVVSKEDSTHTTGAFYASIHITGSTNTTLDDFGAAASGGPQPPVQSYGTDADGNAIHGKCGCGLFADPVNSLSGAFQTKVDDLELPGTGVSFAWSRSYTSADRTLGRLGPGWTDSYSASLSVQGNGDILLHGEDGQQLAYTLQGDGSFLGAPGSLSTLASVAGGYELVRHDQVVYTFDSQGRLLSMKDRNDQGVTLAYDGSGRLVTITDAAGRQATISHNASNLVSQVQSADGRSVSYGYTSGRLTSVTDVRGKTWTFAYDSSGRLTSIRDPLNHAQVTNVYAASGRVQSQTDAVGKTITFAWNSTTQIATATDANGRAWKHDYDAGVLAKEIDPLNNTTQLGHDADLNVSAVTSPTSQQTTLTYDAAGNLLQATAPPSLGSVQKTFVYNARNDPTQVTDARGKVTSYTYTPSGNVETVTQDGIQVGAYSYDAAGRVATFTDGNERTWTYAYFPITGYLESVTDPLGNRTTYTYDAAGRVATRVDPKGNCAGCNPADFRWSYTYDAAGNQLTETDPLGSTTTNVYDDAGRLTSVTDRNGHTTSYTYDDANRLLTETGPDPDGGGPLAAPVTTYTYDSVGNKLTETDPRGNVTTFAHDAANRLIRETGPDPDGAGPLPAPVTTFTYDANSNLASTVEPRGNVAGANPADYRTTFTYDAAGRLLTETRPDPDGTGPAIAPVTTNVYDPVGNLQSVRDANNYTTSYTYDAVGRILTVTAPDLGVTTYTYDDAGNVLTRTDDNNHTTSYAYDGAGRLASETGPDPDGGGPQSAPVTSYTYDPNGNRVTLTDPNGNATPTSGDGVTTYGYDRANRLASIDYSDTTPDVSFTYDAVGNRLTMTDEQGQETRAYDNLDRLLSVTRGSNTFSYVYDANGNVTRRTHPGSVVTDYTYDPLDRLTSVASSGQTTSYAYDVASNLVQTTLPAGNGYVETRAYDRAGRLSDVSSQKGGTVLSRFLATLDPVGNPTQVVRTGSLSQTQTYSYDASDRLLSVCFQAGSCPGASDPFIRWTYDRVGNRLSEQRPSGTTTYSYDGRDRLLSAGATSYTYDQNGNQLSAGSRTFAYDLANRLKSTTQGNTTTTYLYDGDGVRLQASTGAQANRKTNFLWDVNDGLPQIAQERDGSGSLLRRYTYGTHRISMTAGNSTSYYIRDGLGSTANLTSQSGQTQWTWSYEPFGQVRTETKAGGNQPDNFLRFTGEYLDPTGLYHLRARQYDPASGRFLIPDPAEQTVNSSVISAYAYAANRPTVMVDPSGEAFLPTALAQARALFATSPAPQTGNPSDWLGGTFQTFTAKREIDAFRVYGGKSRRVGRWLTLDIWADAESYKRYNSLPPGNSATHIAKASIPVGTVYNIGYSLGGGSQIEIVDPLPPKRSWFSKGTRLTWGWWGRLRTGIRIPPPGSRTGGGGRK